jgi:hypothetical protein
LTAQFPSGRAFESLHHLITALDLGYLEQQEFAALVELLEPVRTKTCNFLMNVRR